MTTEPLSREELNRRRKEIYAITGKEYFDLKEEYPFAPMHRMMLSYLTKYRKRLEEYEKPKPEPYTEDEWLRNEIAQMAYMSGETDHLDVKNLIREDVETEPVITLTEKDFDLYPSSREELAQRVYETVYYDPGSRDTFRHVRHEWLPIIDAVLENLPELIREDIARKAAAFAPVDPDDDE